MKLIFATLLLVSAAAAQWPECSTTFTCDLSYQGCNQCHILNQWCGNAPQYCAECCMVCGPINGGEIAKNQRIQHLRAVDNPSMLNSSQQLVRLVAQQLGLLKPEPRTARGPWKLPVNHPSIAPKPKAPQVMSACIAKISR
jgi:hypothetical protein